MKKIKICYFNPRPSGCTWYRFVIPISALKALDLVDHEYIHFKQDYPEILPEDLDALKRCDLFHLAREWTPYGLVLAKEAKKIGKKIWYDTDDNLFNVPSWNYASKVYSDPKVQAGVIDILRQVDFMTSTQKKLNEFYTQYTRCNKYVIPNIVPAQFFKTERNEDDFINILWAGSATHVEDLKIIAPVVEQILAEFPNVYFTFLGYCLPEIQKLDSLRVKIMPATLFPYEYYGFLMCMNADIAVAPLAYASFNLYKSNVKLLEYGAINTAVIASKIGEYANFIKHRQNGLLADKYIEWYNGLRYLIQNKNERRKLATALNGEVIKRADPTNFSILYNIFLKNLNIADTTSIEICGGFFEKWYNEIHSMSDFYKRHIKTDSFDRSQLVDDIETFFETNQNA